MLIRNDTNDDVSGFHLQRRDVVGEVATAWQDLPPSETPPSQIAAGQVISHGGSLSSIYKVSYVEYRAITSSSAPACSTREATR